MEDMKHHAEDESASTKVMTEQELINAQVDARFDRIEMLLMQLLHKDKITPSETPKSDSDLSSIAPSAKQRETMYYSAVNTNPNPNPKLQHMAHPRRSLGIGPS